MSKPHPLDPAQRLLAAEAEAAAARARLTHTVALLQERLSPGRLMQEARREAAEAGSVAANVGALAAERGVATARRNPGTLAGLTAVAGLFLARHRIAELFRRGSDDETGDAATSLPAVTERTPK